MTAAQRIPEWMVERVALGEHTGDVEVEAERLAAIERDNIAILELLPPAKVAAEVERRLRIERAALSQQRASRGLWLGAGAALAVAAAVLLVLVVRGSGGEHVAGVDPASLDGGTRIKGESRLVVHRKAASGAELLSRGASAAQGDRLQVSYVAAGRAHGVIVSIDGRGEVTLHFPANPGASTALESGRAVPLPYSYELDDAPQFERFVFVTADHPLSVPAVLDAARALASHPDRARDRDLSVPPDWEQTSFLIRKVNPR